MRPDRAEIFESSALVDAFARRLEPTRHTPVAVAFSGGGDSLLALKLTTAWARAAGRRVVAIGVDHRLQADSGAWLERSRSAAMRHGATFVGLAWDGPKPEQGLAAAARAARHRLIADAARAVSANVVVFGHTADDQLEAQAMRAAGLRIGALREWSPSPIWPEGRGLFILRPLLSLRRAEIRARLAADGESWIDDPANENLASPRVRARRRIAAGEAAPAAAVSQTAAPKAPTTRAPTTRANDAALAELARQTRVHPSGALALTRDLIASAAPTALSRWLAAAVTCAGGKGAPPRAERIAALADRLATSDAFAATLGGCQVVADADQVLIARDAGEIARGGLAPIDLSPGEPAVWDGRLELTSDGPGQVRALSGHVRALPPDQRRRLREVPVIARRALPMIETPDGGATCPILAEAGGTGARLLVGARLAGACGGISHEAAT